MDELPDSAIGRILAQTRKVIFHSRSIALDRMRVGVEEREYLMLVGRIKALDDIEGAISEAAQAERRTNQGVEG